MIRPLAALLCLLIISFAEPTYARCVDILDRNQRLLCYDARSIDEKSEDYEALQARITVEQDPEPKKFSIASHGPNYLLPISTNFNSDYAIYAELDELFNDTEVKFQLSIKAPFWRGLWRDSSLWLAYTQKSYWQLYADGEASSPFRETNHEPEIIWDLPVSFTIPGKIQARRVWLTFTHESNGRSEPLSRSWNRITSSILFEKKRFVFSAKTWARINEKPSDDDNPNIEEYMGRLNLGLIYTGKHNTLTLNVKNNLREQNRSGLEFSWSKPLKENFKWYVQVYSGYGENLIDMENYNNRIGVGFALTDWL